MSKSVVVLVLCWLVVLLDGIDLFAYGAVLPQVLDDHAFAMTAEQAGRFGSYATFGMLIGALFVGPLSDRFGRRRLVLLCVAVFSVASASCALAPNPEIFGLLRLVTGLGLGGLIPTALAIATEFRPGKRAFAIGATMTAHQTGGMVAPLITLTAGAAWGWRAVFWISALPIVIVAPLILRFLPESPAFLLARGRRQQAEDTIVQFGITETLQTEDTHRAPLTTLFTRRYLRYTLALLVTSFCGLLCVYGVSTWLPEFMRSNGYALGSALSVLVTINLGGIVGMLVAAPLADKFGAPPIAALWFLATSIGIFALSVKMALPLTYLVVFAAGLFLFSGQSMVYAVAATRYPAAIRATALGWTAGVGRIGAIAGPWLGGTVMAAGATNQGFTVYAGAALLGAAAITVVLRSHHKQKHEARLVPVARPH